ncbi:cellulose biosynthesis protein BcsD [Phenylobacterium sp.]|uniref:cellulose biosynthesis protein BcsD n=1 Tax=Phenylobacterium sp. TaxID=1871053 RepID=UPI00272F6AB0|nr:cellulose biosynthesis protein BcsD [Phenylobacterium sp.]MDP1617994.1 cellulose biosynthesis protein BcsD [Phenylobacterium sp.]MDP1985649.1 cellulose biosynthesis protein BcsD [Phenylobacterium sp.]
MSDISPILPATETQQLNDAYLAARRCSAQWRAFLAALAVELHVGTEREEVLAFLRAVGRRMAGRLPLTPKDTLPELEVAMNEVWGQVDWGWTRLRPIDDGIAIIHGAYPTAFETEGVMWSAGAAAVLEGVYAAWFEAQGSPLTTLKRMSESTMPLEFLHGR